MAAREGDYRQARRRVNYLVDLGLLPRPNNLPCADCGHVWKPGQLRHEYDHHLGYDAQHHEDVEAVCTPCHHDRETGRRKSRCNGDSSGREATQPIRVPEMTGAA